MSIFDEKVLISKSYMTDIANAIREKTETEGLILTSDMGEMIRSISIDSSVDGGFVVNFYDENSQLIQTTSSACGMFVGSPISYECDGWKDINDETVELPITFNNADSIIDLYPVFLEYVEYTVNFADYPITLSDCTSSVDNANNEQCNNMNGTGFYMQVADAGVQVAYGKLNCTVNLPTQNCNKVDITYVASGYDPCINGEKLTSDSTSHIITFDCNGDIFDLLMHVVSNTSNLCTLKITNIRFYHKY